ncbi:MAG: hypothetical protein WA666_13345 [Nitrospirota bacterium]
MNMMQLNRNAVFLVFIGVALLALASPSSAAYVVTLTNGESISAKDYKVNGRTIELKMEGGSASFPRSLVASISAGGTAGNLLSPSSAAKVPAKADAKSPEKADAKADAQSPVPAPGTGEQNAREDTPRDQAIIKGDSDAGTEGVAKPPAEADMTVGEFLDKTEDGDDAVDEADQDGTPEDYQGFMKEGPGPGDNAAGEQ